MKNIAIFGPPRSGTSWLGQLFNSSPQVAYRFQPLFSYAFKGRLQEGASTELIKEFYDDLLCTKDDFVLQTKNVSGRDEGLRFLKDQPTHLVWKEVRFHYVIKTLLDSSDTRIIGIIRHPCAVIHSWLNAPKEFKPEWDPLKEWKSAPNKNEGKREEYNGFEKWKEIALLFKGYQLKYPQRFRIIQYEKLNLQTEKVMKELFEFCELPWQELTQKFIEASKAKQNNDPYSVFKGQKLNNEWKGKLPAEIEEGILSDPGFLAINNYYQWSI